MTCVCRITDNLLDARVQLQAALPDLEIMAVESRIDFSKDRGMAAAQERLQNLLGVRIGPGMLKIIKGLMGDDPACVELGFMAEECCHGAILSLTKGALKKAPLEPADSRDHFSKMVKKTFGCTTGAPLLQKGARFWTALKFLNRRLEGRANRMLTYMRNKLVSVEIPAENTFVAYGFLDDHIYSVETTFQVNGTDMTIEWLKGHWNRYTTPDCPRAIDPLQEAVGLCLTDEEFTQKVHRIVGRKACRHFANLILECSDAVVKAKGMTERDTESSQENANRPHPAARPAKSTAPRANPEAFTNPL
jgi:hypothetical protein